MQEKRIKRINEKKERERVNKLFFLLIAFFLIPLVSAADIAYIVKNPGNPQMNVIEAVEEMGFSYELIDDSDIPLTNFSEYEMILVWDEVISNYDKLPVTEKNSLIANTYYLENWKIAEYSGSQISTGIAKARVYDENWITQGMPGVFEVYDKRETLLYFLPYANKRAPGLKRVVVTDNYQEYPVVGIINPGKNLYGGGISRERIAFFGIIHSDYWTEDSKELFKKLLEWTMHGGDNDYDGFFYDDECNDSNAEVNPDAEEIPYNGLDDDCYGGDLVDVDEDGYDAEEAGGDDCDDEYEDINPGAEIVIGDGIDQNCRKDAPEIINIPETTLEEDFGTYAIDLTEFKIDDEDYGDYLKWSVQSANGFYSEIIDDVVELTSIDNFVCLEGCGFILRLTDSDGMYDEKYFEVIILPINDAPECKEIPVVEWEEEGESQLDLGEYCSDPEGDSLSYKIYDTSTSDGVYMKSFESGKAVFSSVENWNGDDWIVFEVSDGINKVVTSSVILRVLPVNDAPECGIPDLEWEEDTTEELNLDDYCSDPDGDYLDYSVDGNLNVTVIINNSLASFIPDKDWYGTEEVIFSASDGEFSAFDSVNLTVLEMNEPPEFLELNCSKNILEDTEEECEVGAEDFENDDYEFSVSGENSLDCEFHGNILSYISYPDYCGEASCILTVSDDFGYTETSLNVIIECVNDAPRMTVEPDTGSVKIINGKTMLFEAEIWDVENDIIIRKWLLDGEEVGSASAYLFNETIGSYELEIVASDGQEARHKWDIRVGGTSEFTCQEVGGFSCQENEMCYENDKLDVKNEGVCCQVRCQPKFEDIERCENVENKLIIEINEPDAGKNFQIGETIRVDIEVKNNLGEDMDVDVDAYFYDLSEDKIIEEENDGTEIGKGDSEEFSLEFKVEEDLDAGNDYGIFIKANGDYCQEKFVKVKVERVEDVVIKDVKSDRDAGCGENLDLGIKVQNLGSKEQEVKIKVENSELGINEESEEFELDEYGKRNDEKEENFLIILPEDIQGDYKLLIKVLFNGEERRNEKEISVECKPVSSEKIEPILLSSGEKATEKENVKEENDKNRGIIILVTLATTIVVISVIVYLLYIMFVK